MVIQRPCQVTGLLFGCWDSEGAFFLYQILQGWFVSFSHLVYIIFVSWEKVLSVRIPHE